MPKRIRNKATHKRQVVTKMSENGNKGHRLLFHEVDEGDYMLPINLIAENHLREIRE